MITLTDVVNQINDSKLALHLKIDCNEPENVIYIQKASEANYDHELDNEIGHLARYNSRNEGDFRGWVCRDASRKIQSLVSALTRYWKFKENKINNTVLTIL